MKEVTSMASTLQVVGLNACDKTRIYALNCGGGPCKLHECGNNGAPVWMFCGLSNSYTGGYGVHDTFKGSLERAIQHTKVYEFASVKEFLTWALEQV